MSRLKETRTSLKSFVTARKSIQLNLRAFSVSISVVAARITIDTWDLAWG